jgi:hypothetical protein
MNAKCLAKCLAHRKYSSKASYMSTLWGEEWPSRWNPPALCFPGLFLLWQVPLLPSSLFQGQLICPCDSLGLTSALISPLSWDPAHSSYMFHDLIGSSWGPRLFPVFCLAPWTWPMISAWDYLISSHQSWALWYLPVILALGRQRKENQVSGQPWIHIETQS